MEKKKNLIKIIAIIIALIITFFLSIYISYFLHISFSHQEKEILNITFETSINAVFTDEKVRQLFFITYLIFVGLIIYLGYGKNKQNKYQAKVYKVTDDIEIPLPVGNSQYQHGSAWFLDKKKYKDIFGVNEVDLDNETIKGIIEEYKKGEENIDIDNLKEYPTIFKKGGIVVGKEEKGNKEIVYYIDNNLHTLTIGATRSGKTRNCVLPSICNLGLAGESMIISDPKGELYSYTNIFLRALGYNVLTLDFKEPLKSSKYNFLQPVIDAVNQGDIPLAQNRAADIVNALVGETKGEKIWSDGQKSVMKAGIMAVVMENKSHPEYQNLYNVYNFLASMCAVNQEFKCSLIDTYLKDLPIEHPARQGFQPALIAGEKTRASFYTSVLNTLELFTDPYIANITSTTEIINNKIGEEKTAIFMILPDDKTTYYGLCSLFVSQIYTGLVEQADDFEHGGQLHRRVNFILDEFGNFTAIPNFGGFLTVGGGRRIRFNLFLQSFSQLNEKYGDNMAKNILDNCYVWNYLKTANDETAEKISKKLGTYTTTTFSESSSDNGKSSSMNIGSRPLLTPAEVLMINRPYLLVMNSGSQPAITFSPDLSKWTYNKLLGLGDEEYNNNVRMTRSIKRCARECEKLRIWDIEKQIVERKRQEVVENNENSLLRFNKTRLQ